MTIFRIRTDPSRPPAPGVTTLDWEPGARRASIDCHLDFFNGWTASRSASDLLVLAAGIYCADKATPRAQARDSWTRDFDIGFPAYAPDDWDIRGLSKAVSFLTGDRWRVSAYQESAAPCPAGPLTEPDGQPAALDIDAVSLFSGGLDSLCGVIDLLESDSTVRLGLVAHSDGKQASPRQVALHQRLADAYGPDRVILRRYWLRPAPENAKQTVPALPTGEPTTRSRSLLFLSAALALASSVGPDVPVFVPENGYIALNVPLTRARVGSASTRTTHPHFLELLARAASFAGVSNPIINPCEFLTKGEMLAGSRNQPLLEELAPLTVSCSHPEAPRWRDRQQGNCGYCFPCLIRRAALSTVGWDREAPPWNVLADPEFVTDLNSKTGADFRAVLNAVLATRADSTLYRNAPLPTARRGEYLSVWRRGDAELKAWITSGATGELAKRIEVLS